MWVSQIYDDLKTPDVLGTCSDPILFSRLTDAVRLLSNKGIFDPLVGEMDICVCDGCVTLPAEVQTVLGVTQCGQPTILRDEWFIYHPNGGGIQKYASWRYTDVVGLVATFRDPSEPVALVAEVENARDSNTPLRVYGWDANGKRIFTPNQAGDLEDGFLVPTVYGFSQPNPSAPLVARIERVKKEVTNGFVRLLAVNSDGTSHTLIGHYLPYETNPAYQRIRVGDNSWIRIKYKKKNFEVRSTKDWINVDNREILILACKAVQFRRKGALVDANAMEGEAVRLLNEEVNANTPPSAKSPQVIFNEYPVDVYGLYY